VTVPTFLAFVVFLLLPRAASIGSLVTLSGDAYVVFAGTLVLVSMAVAFLLILWIGITSALADSLRALGDGLRAEGNQGSSRLRPARPVKHNALVC